jgi:hypothetical protein
MDRQFTIRPEQMYAAPTLQAKYVEAVEFLRQQTPSRWIMDAQSVRPTWTCHLEEQ